MEVICEIVPGLTLNGVVVSEFYHPVSNLVRCKDCRYWQDNNGGYPHPDCRWGHDETPDDEDYCSFGERKDGDGE